MLKKLLNIVKIKILLDSKLKLFNDPNCDTSGLGEPDLKKRKN